MAVLVRATSPGWSSELASRWRTGHFPPLPDPLLAALPGLRRVLLNYTLDEVASLLTDALAAALGPSVAQLWIVDPTPWGSEPDGPWAGSNPADASPVPVSCGAAGGG